MSPLSLLCILACARAAYLTGPPSFAERLDKLYEKLERLTVAPAKEPQRTESKLYAKLDRLNSLAPDKLNLSDDDEELLTTVKLWGSFTPDQITNFEKDLQILKNDYVKPDNDYGDDDDEEPDGDEEYANDRSDGNEDYEEDTDSNSLTPKPGFGQPVTSSSAYIKDDSSIDASTDKSDRVFRDTVISAVDPIAATNERPKILYNSTSSAAERAALKRAAMLNIRAVVQSGRCLVPQARWLQVRQLVPAADTVYLPPCVQLHRCAPDSGCCYSEDEICAPVDGKYVFIPFYLNKADGNVTLAKIKFFNHTQCACVSRETLQSKVKARIETRSEPRQYNEKARRQSARDQEISATEEPKLVRDEEPTPPPQFVRRCTCPTLFQARIHDGRCSCECDWTELARRRECLSLSRGWEHFGLKDRVCVDNGDCAEPTCEYGPYNRAVAKCPRMRRRVKYHGRRLEKHGR